MPQRLAKTISNAGICSRRKAELLINSGAVKLNGNVITHCATNCDKNSQIEVSGKLIDIINKPRLWIYYKPIGFITANSDPRGRKCIFDSLHDLPRVISIGRLDLNSEGLLLLTNNGDFARKMELPINQFERVYKVRAYGGYEKLMSWYLKQTKGVKSIIIKDTLYKINLIQLINIGKKNTWFKVVLKEGKNREIRKIFSHFNLQINRLIRIKYGKFQLGHLKPGEYEEVLPFTVDHDITKSASTNLILPI